MQPCSRHPNAFRAEGARLDTTNTPWNCAPISKTACFARGLLPTRRSSLGIPLRCGSWRRLGSPGKASFATASSRTVNSWTVSCMPSCASSEPSIVLIREGTAGVQERRARHARRLSLWRNPLRGRRPIQIGQRMSLPKLPFGQWLAHRQLVCLATQPETTRAQLVDVGHVP